MDTTKLKGWFCTGFFGGEFSTEDGVVLEMNNHTVKEFNEPFMVRHDPCEPIDLSRVKKVDGYTVVGDADPTQFHRIPEASNWEYAPRNGMISYRHKAIAIVDIEIPDKPRTIEVILISD